MLPALLVELVLTALVAQVLYALWPYRRRVFIAVLVLSAVGMGLGEAWDVLGLPAFRVGGAALLPGALFAAALQLLEPRIAARLRP